jgi:hypothetical protein
MLMIGPNFACAGGILIPKNSIASNIPAQRERKRATTTMSFPMAASSGIYIVISAPRPNLRKQAVPAQEQVVYALRLILRSYLSYRQEWRMRHFRRRNAGCYTDLVRLANGGRFGLTLRDKGLGDRLGQAYRPPEQVPIFELYTKSLKCIYYAYKILTIVSVAKWRVVQYFRPARRPDRVQTGPVTIRRRLLRTEALKHKNQRMV